MVFRIGRRLPKRMVFVVQEMWDWRRSTRRPGASRAEYEMEQAEMDTFLSSESHCLHGQGKGGKVPNGSARLPVGQTLLEPSGRVCGKVAGWKL